MYVLNVASLRLVDDIETEHIGYMEIPSPRG